MNCLICLKPLSPKSQSGYHRNCLERLFGDGKIDLNFRESRQELIQAMPRQTHGFSISGVQIKCQLAVENSKLKLVDSGGQYIMKPSPEEYPNVSENEHATLTLMSRVGFDVPPCGLLKLEDDHLVFIIRRYDRNFGDGSKIHQEDAMQALGVSNSEPAQKYNSASYQEVLELASRHAGLAVAMELLMRLIFSYLIGNDDHHLKNISFLYEPVFKLTPCYDVLASALYSGQAENPMALRFFKAGQPTYCESMGNGFYAGSDFLELGIKAGLPESAIRKRMTNLLRNTQKQAANVIESSFMTPLQQREYRDLLEQRLRFLNLLDIP